MQTHSAMMVTFGKCHLRPSPHLFRLHQYLFDCIEHLKNFNLYFIGDGLIGYSFENSWDRMKLTLVANLSHGKVAKCIREKVDAMRRGHLFGYVGKFS